MRVVLILAACLLISCGSQPEKAPSIGEAFIGPATLTLRKDIDTKSAGVGVVHHGDRVEIIGQRRLWYKVRTEKGVEGWTDDRQLLDSAQMARLRKLAEETAGLPSQGKATTYDILNVHTEPNRNSPSFVQVQEKEAFDVITHRIVARAAKQPKRQLIKSKPKATAMPKKPGSKKYADPSVPLPPPPNPPAPPVDWIALSKERNAQADADTPPAAQDDWTLIRTGSGQSGWVLTGRVYMLIPDAVAQYAEGHRISSYFSIGSVDDHGEKHDIWLWTTTEALGEDYDFDSYRVFTWSLNHHRYETAYIQRRERGYLPVIVKPGEFSVCVEDKSGARVRKDYTLIGNAVRPSGVRPCEARAEADIVPENQPIVLHAPVAAQKPGYADRMRAAWKKLFSRK